MTSGLVDVSSRRVQQIAKRLIILCCALYLSGLHWLVVQTVAWTGMLVERAERVGIVEAARSTFDGKSPCSLCRVVDGGRAKEKEQKAAAMALDDFAKIQCLMPPRMEVPGRGEDAVPRQVLSAMSAEPRADAPGVPPPRIG